MVLRVKAALIVVTLFFCFSLSHAQQAESQTKAVQLIGLADLKQNTEGRLTIINGTLRFTHEKGNADVPVASIDRKSVV